ncbi:MAG: 16S rRNA (cytosine(1402)-N(4))-methyltransferase, partial [Armatimonadetes bacterium]|nr:16S rRNA (cytosine(1402)-N(4))-methyltransferase [Armatimonadota bacterium]
MIHRPVLVAELLEVLRPRSGRVYFDGTLGCGGHAEAILEASSPDGRLIGCDRDPLQLEMTRARLAGFGDRAILVRGTFEQADEIVSSANVDKLDGFLIDCGGSLDQLSPDGEVGRGRGFSWRVDEPLLMSYDPDSPRTGISLLAEASEEQLREIFAIALRPGEVGRVVRAVARRRRSGPIETTGQLV